MIGALCTNSSDHQLQNYKWDFTLGYRFQTSARHFVGTVEQVQREANHNQIRNTYHLWDLAVNYQINPRWSVNASLPIQMADRNQLYNPRGLYKVNGIGDATLGVKAWLWRPPTENNGNIQLGISLKMPTGNSGARQNARNALGQTVYAVADQSIQAGDGTWGFSLDTQMYKRIWWNNTLYFSGLYLFTPVETNNVPTFRARPKESFMSVSDQYLYRGGISRPAPFFKRMSVSIGGRIEGVPVRDAFGGSTGFRRPGYSISVDPGFMYSTSRYTFAMNIPFAVERNRKRSVPDIADGRHGDAAFADFAIITSLTARF